MRRPHRSVHRALWPALALAVAVGFLTALILRPPPQPEPPKSAQEMRK